MAFLPNDGSIILDCVLTDTGRMRLAKGDGSFKITKFFLSDTEVDYGMYNKSHPSGSAYYDLNILQAPVLEAFTNNTSVGKYKLISIPRTNLLYLPVIKINNIYDAATALHSSGAYVVAVDEATETDFGTITGVISGESLDGGSYIRLDQGLDTTEIPASFTIDSDLVETQYIIELDNRFGKVVSANGVLAKVSYIDDDQIASYFLSLGTDIDFVEENTNRSTTDPNQIISGPRGTFLKFRIQASLELNTSTYLFEKMGSTISMTNASGTPQTVYYVDTFIRVTGASTGFAVDIPVRFIKK